MGRYRKENTLKYEREVIKLEIKDEVIEELDEIIAKKVKEYIGPAVVESVISNIDIPVTVKQLAHLMGRSVPSVYKMLQRGQIPYTKVGSQIHVNLKDVSNKLLLIKRPEK